MKPANMPEQKNLRRKGALQRINPMQEKEIAILKDRIVVSARERRSKIRRSTV